MRGMRRGNLLSNGLGAACSLASRGDLADDGLGDDALGDSGKLNRWDDALLLRLRWLSSRTRSCDVRRGVVVLARNASDASWARADVRDDARRASNPCGLWFESILSEDIEFEEVREDSRAAEPINDRGRGSVLEVDRCERSAPEKVNYCAEKEILSRLHVPQIPTYFSHRWTLRPLTARRSCRHWEWCRWNPLVRVDGAATRTVLTNDGKQLRCRRTPPQSLHALHDLP